MIQCSACGTQLYNDAQYCEQCGTKIVAKPDLDTEIWASNYEHRPLPFTFVLILNLILAGLAIIYAISMLFTPTLVYSQKTNNFITTEVITKSFSSSILICILFLFLALFILLVTFKLKNYSFKARNATLAIYFLVLLISITTKFIIGFIVVIFVFWTLFFHKNLQDLWDYNK